MSQDDRVLKEKANGLERRLLTTCRWHVVTAVAFPRESESILAHHFKTKTDSKRKEYGGLAQLGERLPCKQEVSGSIPLISTK